MTSERSSATLDLAQALRVVGWLGFAVGIATIGGAALAYASSRDFSVFTTYISDFGAAGGWTQVIYTTGMLIAAPLRYLFLVLLLAQLVHRGASPRFRTAMLVVGAFVVLGSIGTAAVPYTLSLPVHEGSAFLYFLGTVALQTSLAVTEWRLRLPRALPLASLAVVAVYFLFAALPGMVGKVEGIDRQTPVPWEWLAFAALMIWLVAHTVVLGARDAQAVRSA